MEKIRSEFLFWLIKLSLILIELPIIYFLNKSQYASNIFYMGKSGAYIYHLMRVGFYLAPVSCIYILINAYLTNQDGLTNKIQKNKSSILILIFNIIMFFSLGLVVKMNNFYIKPADHNDYVKSYEAIYIIKVTIAHVLELLTLISMPFLLFKYQEWRELFEKNLSRVVKIILALTFMYVGYIDRIISDFIGLRLINTTVYLAQIFYKFTGGSIHIYDYSERGLPILTDKSFYAEVNPGCAGYEGISFILFFLILFYPYLRKFFNIYEMAGVFLICMGSVFILNSIRIALLIYIGENISADVAVGGFHTNFGVLTLVMVSVICMSFVWAKSNFTSKAENITEHKSKKLFYLSQDGKFIIPLFILISTSLLTGIFSGSFNWLYPVPITLSALSVFLIGRNNEKLSISFVCISLFIGALVFGIWIWIIPRNENYEADFLVNLYSHGQFIAVIWLIFRLLGSSFVVPFAEELAFRGGLWNMIFESLNPDTNLKIRKIICLLLTSIAFGFMHDDIAAAIIAGLLYGLLRFFSDRKSYPIIAHSFTNFLISIYAIGFHAWSYW